MKHLCRYNTFILEYSKPTRTQKISLEDAVRIYNEKCSDWDLHSEKQIWRGSSTSHKLFYINPNENEYRKSVNTDGVYQSLLPHLKSWENAPRRDKSLIMSTSDFDAGAYNSDLFLMIPFNNSKIGICPYDDIWKSVDYMKELTKVNYLSWEIIDYDINGFMKNNAPSNYIVMIDVLYNNPRKDWKYPLIDIINDVIQSIDNIPRNELILNERDSVLKSWISDYPNLKFSEFITMLFDFDKNGFKITSSRNQENLPRNREVWSDGEFLGIHSNFVNEFIEKLKS